MTDAAARRDAIIKRCHEIFRKAEALYGVDLGRVAISFKLRGRTAGLAGARIHRYLPGSPATDLSLKFNWDMITGNGYDHILNDCVPHEIAHLVCYVNPSLGRNHDRGWQRVCVALGGNGERCHTEDVLYAKGNTYEYETSTGAKIQVGDKHHSRIQAGATLRAHRKVGGGVVNRASKYAIVGINGRRVEPTVVTPVQTGGSNVDAPAPKLVSQDRPSRAPATGVARTVLVREWIRQTVAQGHSQEYCELMCGRVFGMSQSQGKSYVKTQWVRAMTTRD